MKNALIELKQNGWLVKCGFTDSPDYASPHFKEEYVFETFRALTRWMKENINTTQQIKRDKLNKL